MVVPRGSSLKSGFSNGPAKGGETAKPPAPSGRGCSAAKGWCPVSGPRP
jgi:hypothetical protein